MLRLQKLLADAGYGSRRTLEKMMQEGRITVNGKLAELGCKACAEDSICLDGKRLNLTKPKQDVTKVILYHKPAGEICSRHDPEGRRSVFDSLPKIHGGRWISVGRLDYATSGLLLFTNQGELAHKLMHPSAELEREYAVRILGDVSDVTLKQLQKGVKLDDGVAKFDSISFSGGTGSNRWYHVTLCEGRNREVRRLWESQGLTVSRLTRIRFAHLQLPRELAAGKYRFLPRWEVDKLLQVCDVKI